jgi:MFS family permease
MAEIKNWEDHMGDITIPKRDLSHLLINRNFALLWIGQTISNAGDLFFDTTLSLWIITHLAKGASWAPLAVSVVDRWDKRRTMLIMDLGRALLISLLFFMAFFAPQLSVPLILGSMYLICALTSTFSQFFGPARMTLIKDIVPSGQLTRASGLSSAAINIALIAGPILAAPLYFAAGAPWAIAFNVFSFLASWLAIFSIRVSEPVQETSKKQTTFWHDFVEGLHFYRHNRVLMVLLIAGIFFNLGAGASNALYVLFVLQNLHTPPNLVGLFAALYGIGLISGSLLSAFFVPRLKEPRVFWLALLSWGLGIIIFACLTNFIPGLLLFLFLGFCNAGIVVVVGPLKLRVTPRELVGRVEAVMMPVIIASQLLSVLCAGSLSSTLLVAVHFSWLGISFGPLVIIFLGVGFMGIFGGIYALLALRNVVIPQEVA